MLYAEVEPARSSDLSHVLFIHEFRTEDALSYASDDPKYSSSSHTTDFHEFDVPDLEIVGSAKEEWHYDRADVDEHNWMDADSESLTS